MNQLNCGVRTSGISLNSTDVRAAFGVPGISVCDSLAKCTTGEDVPLLTTRTVGCPEEMSIETSSDARGCMSRVGHPPFSTRSHTGEVVDVKGSSPGKFAVAN
jgi:hypothetical protein